MTTKELTISDNVKKLLMLAVVAGAIFALTASFAFALHPGQDRNGDVPQGPHQTACDNQGRDGNGQGRGIDHAITSGGMVHCEEPVPHCVEVTQEEINSGACTDLSLIDELNIPQCCTLEGPGGIDCGADAEWVVGVAAFPTCYIPGS